MDSPHPKLERILELTKNIYDANILLPEFQRNFVWTNENIKDLAVSILNGYFIGTFLFLRRGDDFEFAVRYFEGTDKVNSKLPKIPNEKLADRVVLDGQQRLTALFYLIYNPPDIKPKGASYPYRYFIKIHEKLVKQESDDKQQDKKEWDDVIWSISENDSTRNLEIDFGEGDKKYSFQEIIKKTGGFKKLLEKDEFKNYCYENGVIPFSFLKDESELMKWLYDYIGYFMKKGKSYPEMTEKTEKIRKLFSSWFGFEVPTLTLEKKPLYQVAEIFERINRTGVELSIFALATAVFYKKGMNLRKWWEEYYQEDDSSIKKFCEIDNEEYPKYILQIIALLQGKEVKKKILINPSEFQIDEDKWKEACLLLENALKKLQNTKTGYGVISPDMLPYRPILVTLSSLLKHSENSDNRYKSKLDIWYWSSVFSGRYSTSSDTIIKRDYDQMIEWFNDDTKKPEVVINAEKIIDNLDLYKLEKGALYKAILNMIALKGAQDFFKGESIELLKLDDHHIFPKKSGIDLTNENSILNRTLISSDTNKEIYKYKPSIYLEKMVKKIGDEDKVKKILATHLIDENCYEAMKNDDYEKFLHFRNELIINEIKNKIITN